MTWIKRIGFFILTNFLIMITISVATSVLAALGLHEIAGIQSHLVVYCLIWGMAGSFLSLLLSKFMAKSMMGVKVIDPSRASGYERELVEIVSRFAKKAKLPMPEVGIYESPEVNAFATGPSKSSSLVAVSTGLLNRMNQTEVEGVVAHEISHIANGDMVTLTLIQGIVNSLSMLLSRLIASVLASNVKEEMQMVVRFTVTIALDILFTLLGSIAVAYFSRMREFRADTGGATLAGKASMIAALENLKRLTNEPEDERGEAFASFKISSKKGGFISLFATHPSLEDRIGALRKARIL